MRVFLTFLFGVLICLGAACGYVNTESPAVDDSSNLASGAPQFSSTRFVPENFYPSTQPKPTPTETLVPDTGWQPLEPGLERRIMNIRNEGGNLWENLYFLRIEPEYFRFEVGYNPGTPKRLMDWQSETGAKMTLNGGFFTESNEATGLIITEDGYFGTSYQGFGGMLAISEEGPEIRSLTFTPYDASEPLLFALQSFPMLVQPGGEIGLTNEDGRIDRRTAIAQDRDGRILLIFATSGRMTLFQLSQFLINSDLEIDRALNLDGGSSSGILLTDPVEGIPPFVLLPIVISIHNKN